MRTFVCAVVSTVFLLTVSAGADAQLVEYVNKPDDSFKVEVLREQTTKLGVRCIELRVISQTWKEVTWKHKVYLACPKTVKKAPQGVFVISGGSWRAAYDADPQEGDELPKQFEMIARVAMAAKMPVGTISHVPFQPIFGELKEDAAIAYTYAKYLKTGDGEWPLLLPMTKSAVRGLDAFQQIAAKHWKLNVKNFVVTGASKRGWTTWLTAVADKRVNGIAPMVFDTLNLPAQMKHQLASYGKYSEQIDEYTELNIQKQMDTSAGRKLNAIVDPYAYRDRLTMPKMIINGSNDPYWVVDSLNLYWDGLKGDKWVMYVPNAGHGLNRDFVRIISNISGLARRVAGKLKFPSHRWGFDESADSVTLRVKTDGAPSNVYAWTATAETRDFRKSTWTSQAAEKKGNGYVYRLARPKKGYAAVFGEAQHNIDGQMLFLCTQVKVIQADDQQPAATK